MTVMHIYSRKLSQSLWFGYTVTKVKDFCCMKSLLRKQDLFSFAANLGRKYVGGRSTLKIKSILYHTLTWKAVKVLWLLSVNEQ